MQDARFKWDDDKARANLAKHRLNFHVAKLAFDDAGANDEPGETMDYSEDSYRRIGMALDRLVVVELADRYHIALATLIAWEQHETEPDAVALAFMDAIAGDPEGDAKALRTPAPASEAAE